MGRRGGGGFRAAPSAGKTGGGFFGRSSSSVPQKSAPAPAPAAPSRPSTASPSAQPPKSSMVRDIATTAGGVALGHAVIGGASHMMGGSGSNQGNGAEQAAVAQTSPCAVQMQSFTACLEANNNSIQTCQFAWDMVQNCQRDQQQQQF